MTLCFQQRASSQSFALQEEPGRQRPGFFCEVTPPWANWIKKGSRMKVRELIEFLEEQNLDSPIQLSYDQHGDILLIGAWSDKFGVWVSNWNYGEFDTGVLEGSGDPDSRTPTPVVERR